MATDERTVLMAQPGATVWAEAALTKPWSRGRKPSYWVELIVTTTHLGKLVRHLWYVCRRWSWSREGELIEGNLVSPAYSSLAVAVTTFTDTVMVRTTEKGDELAGLLIYPVAASALAPYVKELNQLKAGYDPPTEDEDERKDRQVAHTVSKSKPKPEPQDSFAAAQRRRKEKAPW